MSGAASQSLEADLAELEAVTWELERRGEIEPDFGGWLARARPSMRWHYPHMRLMQARINDLIAGRSKRQLLEVAGRHGKTEHITSLAGYLLERDTQTRILLGTYSQQQARKLSRHIRRLARRRGVLLATDNVDDWETVEGGGLRAVGLGAGTASVNADWILLDDPIGNRADAESLASRDRVWDAITTDILARAEPQTRAILSMPRWHEDDPIGRAKTLQKGRWNELRLPGRSEGDGDPLGRPKGGVLWPEFRDEEWHEGVLADLLPYGYASFIQCAPRPRSGGMFKWAWWREMDEVPALGHMVRYWDLAGTAVRGKTHDPDYTAGALLCRMEDKRTAIVNVERFRYSVAQRDARLEAVCREDLATYGRRVSWWIETEAGIAGKDRTDNLVRRLQALGMAVYTEHPTGDKVLRAEPLASAAEAQNVVLCPGEWRDPFRSELADFPNGSHDDQTDAAAGAYAKISVPHVRTKTFAWRV